MEFVSPAYAFYNIEGLFLFILSLFLVKRIEKIKRNYHFIILGIITAAIFLIKQSYGIANIATVVLSIYYYENKRILFKNTIIYLTTFGIILSFYILYLFYTQAFDQFMYYVFSFSREVKGHRTPFIITAFMFIPMYFILLNILRKATLRQRTYIFSSFIVISFLLYLFISPERVGRLPLIIRDFLVYYYLALLIIPLSIISFYWNAKTSSKKELVILSFFSLGLFLASASSGRDYATVFIVSPFFLPLSLSFVQQIKINNKKWISIVILLVYTFPFFLFKAKIVGETHNNTYIKNIKPAMGIKVQSEIAFELEEIVRFIKSGSSKNDKIICFPYCPLLFVLSETNSASYYSFFYPETFQISNQQKVIKDISKNKPKMIVLQRSGKIEPEANFEDNRLKILKYFFLSHYKIIKKTKNFSLYVPNYE